MVFGIFKYQHSFDKLVFCGIFGKPLLKDDEKLKIKTEMGIFETADGRVVSKDVSTQFKGKSALQVSKFRMSLEEPPSLWAINSPA